MLRASMTPIVAALLLCVLAHPGIAQQPATPAPNTTTAAPVDSLAKAKADSLAAVTDSLAAAADSMAAAATDSLAAVADSVSAAAKAAAAGTAAAPAAGAATAPTAPKTTPTQTSTTAPAAAAPTSAEATSPRRLYYGGTVGFDFFGDQTRFYIEPMVGIEVRPRLSVGFKVGYEHLKVDLAGDDITSDNWGASVFGRMKLLRRAYAHAEYSMWRYETFDGHDTVPFILLGGGVIQPLTPRTSLWIEALYDVLQDDKSPYEEGEPWVSVGVGVGF